MPLFDGRPTSGSGGGGGGGGISIGDLIDAERVEYITLSLADVTNKYFTYGTAVGSAPKLKINTIEGTTLRFGTDYTVNAGLNRVEWNALALDGLVAAGDTFQVVYNTTT